MLKQNDSIVRVGVIGLGYWGPNLVRVLSNLDQCRITALCDRDPNRLKEYCDRFPTVHGTTDASEVLSREMVDAVIIAIPTKTHYELALEALSQGIHTFVEKPLVRRTSTEHPTSLSQAEAAPRPAQGPCTVRPSPGHRPPNVRQTSTERLTA